MSLFQSVVVKRYINELDAQLLEQAWQRFASCFLDLAKQDNIRLSKEEQYQEGFLRDLFVDVLGYTLNPNPHYNLTTEFKNQTSSKKADGAILKDGHAIGVIELKGMNTTDMSKIEAQAFGYKNNQPKCRYVITSNFQKLRLYIDNAVDYEEFDLFAMSQDDFALLYLLLCQTSITADLPAKIKSESLSQEEAITKQLYKDYSVFKRELFADLTANNPSIDALILFQKSQKLLDRLLFIFFAEDSHLLPANFAKGIINEWQQLKALKRNEPLYDQIKQYFTFLDTGYKDEHSEIFAYNGGLFRADALLDSVIISDELLRRHILTLSEYDFDSEVDVNILGHIFENSLSELDEVKAQLAGEAVDKSQTKRKKDGVFYTPKYITKYIVENTVGKLCEDKKVALALNEEDYQLDVTLNKSGKKRKKTDKRIAEEKEALDRLHAYRDWLLETTICDPACGSGAFLNEALNFLIAEHSYIVELETKLFGSGLAYPDIENSILENNLFGVDINEESVEIAKLSLWLRTAQPYRKLNNLNDNIQCGNSLIDDPKVAGDKAFNWQTAFPQVFAKGGFDVVIGNPPYLRMQGLRENFEKESKFYDLNFKSATGRFDIYVLFIEKSFDLIKIDSGVISYILPHKFLISGFGEGIRGYLVDKKGLESLIHFGSEMVFADASAYTCIVKLSYDNSKIDFANIKPQEISNTFNFDSTSYKLMSNDIWNFKSEKVEDIFNKLNSQVLRAEDVFSAISAGVDTGSDDIFIMKGKIIGKEFHGYSDRLKKFLTLEASIVKPMLKGGDVKRYAPISNDYFVIYPFKLEKGKTIPMSEECFKENYPASFEYLFQFKEELVQKKIHKKTNSHYWYSLHRSRNKAIFEQSKIITPETSLGGNLTIDHNHYFHNTQVYLLIKKDSVQEDYRFWLSILNSSIFWFFLKETGAVLRGGYFRFKTKHLEPFPLPKLDNLSDEIPYIKCVDFLVSVNENSYKVNEEFIRYFTSSYQLDKISRKLETWHELTFADFIKELTKAIKATNKVRAKEGQSPIAELTKTDEFEWMELFGSKKQEVMQLQQQIQQTEQEIDQMVYKLYDLTADEIAIIEAS